MIESSTLDAIAQEVTRAGFSDAAMGRVRGNFPGLRLTFCLEDEMGVAEPFREYAGFSLYLVSGGDHCLGLTDDPDNACGVVVAEVD